MAVNINISPGEFVFPSGLVTYAGGTATVADNSGGPLNGQGGDGNYTVSLNSSGVLVITKGPEPQQTPLLQHLANVHVVQGVARITDRRTVNVTAAQVNANILASPDPKDGSSMATGVVTERVLSGEVTDALAAAGIKLLGGDTDIDFSTERPSFVLAAAPTGQAGLPFYWVPRTLAALTDIDPTNEVDGNVLSVVTISVLYDDKILATPGLTHFWPLSDPAGSTTVADRAGAAPGTVSGPGLGAPSITGDGETCFLLSQAAASLLTVPAVLPASGPWTLEFVLSLPEPSPTVNLNAAIFSTSQGSSFFDNLTIILNGQTGFVFHYLFGAPGTQESSYTSVHTYQADVPLHMALAYDGVNTISVYFNGRLDFAWTNTTAIWTPATESIFGEVDGSLAKVAFYDVALTAVQVLAHSDTLHNPQGEVTAFAWLPPSAPSTGGSGDGGPQTTTAPAAVALSGQRVVVAQSDGTLVYDDSTNAAFRALPASLTTAAFAEGTTATVLVLGYYTEPSWTWTPEVPLYLGQEGALTQTVPSAANGDAFQLQCGVAITATTILWAPLAPIALA